LNLERAGIDEWRVKQLTEAVKTNRVTPQRVSLDSLNLVLHILQFLSKLNMHRNKLNPKEIKYLAEALKINKVITQYYFSSYHPSTFHDLADADGVGSSME
jgi:adenine-specific DNA methylase